ncbi:hypothetical protein E1B28_005808 [Marasmius oreades]|uniref:PBP domain-containing protein n=1 Tax=Marasmius oreades TaxID=181124 RepID=A0A9P7UW93_9AGAR|nr:uncharacterized protein E1B28_005808 [Marasmius oreades]KAG7095014.1 hypothetical protein E1B28_005808 [Marasmius oreades]
MVAIQVPKKSVFALQMEALVNLVWSKLLQMLISSFLSRQRESSHSWCVLPVILSGRSVQSFPSLLQVAWYLGDTTQSLQYLASKFVDVALTYNAAAEKHCVDSGAASQRELVFLDHFYLVGPKPNPAELSTSNDSVTDMFNKIVASGNEDTLRPPNPSIRPPTRFLSRFDKSATNIKESELFVKIGQVPWAYAYSTWYHQYARFPLQALEAASYLAEYTLTDRGTWLSSPSSVTSNLVIYKGAESTEDEAVLLNPCSALSAPDTANKEMAEDFMNWVVRDDGGQQVVKDFKKNGERLYSPRPKKQ